MLKKNLLLLFSLVSSFSFAETPMDYDIHKPFPAFHIIDNIYYVGTNFQADYLIATPKGNILINTGYADNVPQIKASVQQLGFKWEDTKIVLISHAHNDHTGGTALVKTETGAKVEVMQPDVATVESGGKTDFQYGQEPNMWYPPVKVDRVLKDGDKVELGGTVLVAHLTPGHTPGNTTWTMNVKAEGHTYPVVIVGAVGVNPGYKLVNNSQYPSISKDYAHTFDVLSNLPCAVFLGAHGMYFNLQDKYPHLATAKTNPFIDPKGYQAFVKKYKEDFENELANQS